ncbi:hypothetical protein D3C81_2020300 [compost metagenome]
MTTLRKFEVALPQLVLVSSGLSLSAQYSRNASRKRDSVRSMPIGRKGLMSRHRTSTYWMPRAISAWIGRSPV